MNDYYFSLASSLWFLYFGKRILPTFFADLVIFESDKIKDNATFTNPKNGPTGIDYVFVNGKKAVEKGHEKDVFSGSIIKK